MIGEVGVRRGSKNVYMNMHGIKQGVARPQRQ
jgi:hypothetical protein